MFLLPKDQPGKFRPIALASCLLKLCERLITNRLTWWLERGRILPADQYGFRILRSCADNLAIIATEAFTAVAQKQFAPCIFLDVKGAFDNVDPNIVYRDLAQMGIPRTMAKFIYALLAHRRLHVVVEAT